MATIRTGDSFLAVVKKSGLIEADHLHWLLQKIKHDGIPPEDAAALADALVTRKALTRWQAEKLLRGRHRGFFLGKYRLLSLLGRGGMSSVYLAEHVLMRRRCAIKVLPARRVKDSSHLARFHREAQAVASLDHPNIVRAYDVDSQVSDGTEVHFIVMEYVEGRSLLELVNQQGPLGIVQAADCIRQAAEGLAHAHKAGMVHRDVKPGNLLVDARGVVKLLDLGLARFFREKDEKSLTMANEEKVLGTADYLAPEQALDSHNVDTRADIYGLGCTFYFLLAGHAPFTDGTLAQRLMSHQTKRPPPIQKDRPDVPAELDTIIRTMMAKNKQDRYQTAEQLVEVLEDWLMNNAGQEWIDARWGRSGSGSGTLTESHRSPSPATETEIPPAPSGVPANHEETSSDSPGPARPPLEDVSATMPGGSATADAENEGLATFLSRLETETETASPDASSPDGPADADPSNVSTDGQSATGDRTPDADRATTSQSPTAQPVEGSTTSSGNRSPDAAPVAVPVAPASSVPDTSSSDQTTTSPPRHKGKDEAGGHGPMGGRRSRRSMPDLIKLARTPGAKIAGASAAVLLVIGLGIVLFKPSTDGRAPESEPETISNSEPGSESASKNDETPDPSAGPPLPREVSVGPDGDFPTIGDALARVKAEFKPLSRRDRQVIKIAGGTYPERLTIDDSDSSWPKGIRLVAANTDPEPVVLTPPGPEPILSLKQVENVQLEGLHIRAEGKPVAVVLSGYLSGVHLKGIRVSGFEEAGILGRGPTGFSGEENQVTLDGLVLENADPQAVGIRFHSDHGAPSQIRIENSRVLGPLSAGIVFEGDARFVSVRNTIVSNVHSGLRFDGPEPELRELTLQNNSFHQLECGIRFKHMPSASGGALRIERNLFAEMEGPETLVENGYRKKTFLELFAERGIAENWSSRPAPSDPAEGEVDIFVVNGHQGRDIEFLSTDPADRNFLRPAPDAPYAPIGAAAR